MVRLNCLLALCCLNALENVGVDGALSEELDAFELSCFFNEYFYEFFSYYLSLCLGITYSCEKIEVTVGSIDVDKVSIEVLSENFDNLFGLTLSHKTVIYVYAYQLLADRFDEEGGYHG